MFKYENSWTGSSTFSVSSLASPGPGTGSGSSTQVKITASSSDYGCQRINFLNLFEVIINLLNFLKSVLKSILDKEDSMRESISSN